MTGMKEGAGEDPFAESDDNAKEQDDEHVNTADQIIEQDRSEGTIGGEDSVEGGTGSAGKIQIPYKFRRDGVKDGRDRVPLFLQEETKRSEREVQRKLESRLGDSVSTTDLREALVKVGLDNVDSVEGVLQEWGYGMEFD